MTVETDKATPLGPVVIDVEGKALTAADRRRLTHPLTGGVILFARNYESSEQLSHLTADIHALRDPSLIVCVDHEGGRVQRFKKGFTLIPTAQSIGQAGSPRLAFEIAEVMAKELKAVGVNVNYAPVADIQTNPKNPVIGSRAYGSDEDTVTKIS
ncbi:MAG: glycoside hydrolase family 3 N-terminal domain-containing protein, partial [Burkholderiales bacterium]